MILNKFRTVSYYKVKALILQLLALGLFSCKKTANINANKAYVNVTHTAYNTGPVVLKFDGIPLFMDSLVYGQTTDNSPNGPYDTTTAGVHDLQILVNDSPLLTGNMALQQQTYYSLFVYDTLNQNTFRVIIFQDFQSVRTDTLTYVRYLNFTPGLYSGLLVVYPRDTTKAVKASSRDTVNISPRLFIGYNPNPSAYQASTVHIGKNNVFAYVGSPVPVDQDSSNFWYMGSFTFDSTKNYNIFLQGYPDTLTGPDTFRLKSIKLN